MDPMAMFFAVLSSLVALVAVIVSVIVATLRIGEWKGRVDERLGTFARLAKDIRQDMALILARLSPTTNSDSPVQLNEIGRVIAGRIDAERWATEIAPTLAAKIEGLQPFQIDQFCRAYVDAEAYDAMSPDWRERVGVAAYESGVDRWAVLDVLYVALRERLIAVNQGIG